MQIYLNNNKNFFFCFLQKSNRLSTKQDHCSSQKSLVFKKNTGRKGNTVKSQQNKNTNVPLSLVIPRLELQDQPVLECGVTQHTAAKRPCGLSRLWRRCGCRGGGMSDCQPAWRGMQGTPGWRCRWGFLGVWAWFTAWLVLYFGYTATLAQPPMP